MGPRTRFWTDSIIQKKNDFHLHRADGSHSEIFNRPWDSGIKPRTFCISGENIAAVYPPKMVFQQTLLIELVCTGSAGCCKPMVPKVGGGPPTGAHERRCRRNVNVLELKL